MARILSLTGTSCSGKTTLAAALVARYKHVRMGESVTTRQARSSDIPGEYRHISLTQFKELEAKGRFLWTIEHDGTYYGTERSTIIRALEAREEATTILILAPSVLPLLYQFTLERMQETGDAIDSWVACYINEPSLEVLMERYAKRGDAPESMLARRVAEANWWKEACSCGKQLKIIRNCGAIDQAVARLEPFLFQHQIA